MRKAVLLTLGAVLASLIVASGVAWAADVFCTNVGNNRCVGTADHDYIQGTFGRDRMFGLGGNDELRGENPPEFVSDPIGAARDYLSGGQGGDTLSGGPFSDRLRGGSGSDVMHGDYWPYGAHSWRSLPYGDDKLYGGPGPDSLLGERGDDLLSGGVASDEMIGERGADVLQGGSGSDLLQAGWGDDTLYPGDDAVKDVVNCGRGFDVVYGVKAEDVPRDCERVR